MSKYDLIYYWQNYLINQENVEFKANSYVLKCTHGCATNIIVKDKNDYNVYEMKSKLKKWLSIDYSKIAGERHYSLIKPRIICEKYIANKNEILKDYKIYCFNGKAEFIQVISDRGEDIGHRFYDINWNETEFNLKANKTRYNIEKPLKLKEMIDIAEKLADNIPFVRVDLYYTNNKIYFGELTFTPKGGIIDFYPRKYNYIFGNKINI